MVIVKKEMNNNTTKQKTLLNQQGGSEVYIINGNRDGSPNENRWDDAKTVCQRLGGPSNPVRIPAVFCDTPTYKNVCGTMCAKHELKDHRKARGCMIAHKNLLHEFDHSNATTAIVLEDDVTLPSEDAIETRVHNFIEENADKNLLFIGHCYSGVCTHAIRWTKEGAQKALKHVDWCSTNPIDVQLRSLCHKKILNCAWAPNVPNDRGTWGDGLVHQSGNGTNYVDTHL